MEALLEQVNALSTDDKLIFFRKMSENLTLGEIVKLVPQLEEAWDVKATPAVPDWMKQGGGQEVEEEVEQTEFDVVVTNTGSKRIQVVKIARVLADISLKESSDLLKQLPATVLTKVGKDKAAAAKTQLEESGATVEIQ